MPDQTPQIEGPLLAGENPVDEHDLDHVDKLKLLVHKGLETGLESGQLLRTTPKILRMKFGARSWKSRP